MGKFRETKARVIDRIFRVIDRIFIINELIVFARPFKGIISVSRKLYCYI